MKLRILFGASMAANLVLLSALAYYWHYTSAVPDYTPPLVWQVFTNAPLTAEAYQTQWHNLQTLAGFDTNSVNPTR